MNIDPTDKDIEMADKGDPKLTDGHDHGKVHVDDPDCGLENETRTVYLDQGVSG